MLDLLADLGDGQRACVIVPKLDLMEQIAQLLEKALLKSKISRVGTNSPADFKADIFVCVRNSAWQLQNVTLDLLLLDEAHHYEPSSDQTESGGGIHARRVLSLKAAKRIFFSATLLRNAPDFDFGLRPAIEAGVIKDYTVMVPVVTEGDPRPSLVKLIQKMLLACTFCFCPWLDEQTLFVANQFVLMVIFLGCLGNCSWENPLGRLSICESEIICIFVLVLQSENITAFCQ